MSLSENYIHLRTGESIPLSSLEYATSRSGGPGGQNVNKVETKVEVRLDVLGSPWIEDATRQILAAKLASRMDSRGMLRIASTTERTQRGNRIAATTRLDRILNDALIPEKKRLATRATKGSKERRLEFKKRLSDKKQARKWDDH